MPQAVDFNDQKYTVVNSSRNYRTRNSGRDGKIYQNKHASTTADKGIANRLRKRKSSNVGKQSCGNGQKRYTRSMTNLNNQHSNNTKTTPTSQDNRGRRRDAKSIEKDLSSISHSELEEMKINFDNKYSKREEYYNLGNAVYQEYDEFLKKRRKDKRAEFIKIHREHDEEIPTMKNSKDLLRYFGAPTADQDTF